MTISPSCPVCGGTSALWAKPYGRWHYHQCHTCGHVHVDPVPTVSELRDYYSGQYGYSDEALAASVRDRYVGLIEANTPSRTGGRTVLEHGANTGLLLAALQKRGWEVAGTELGEHFREAAHARKIDVRPGLSDFEGRRFDLIVAFHVLEHVADPLSDLRVLLGMLEAGGLLLIKTPNVRSIPARAFPEEWEWSTPPAHLHLFSPQSLERVLVRAGAVPSSSYTERGNAKPLLFELARAGAHRALRVLRGRPSSVPGLSRPQVRSDRPWYRAALVPAEMVDWALRPLDRVLGSAGLLPELTAIARPGSPPG